MPNSAASTADIMGQIRRLRQEFGSAICDIILAELIRGQNTSDLLGKLGVTDPGYGFERVQVLTNYLRRKGATEFVCSVTNVNRGKGDAALQTIQVDANILKALISQAENPKQEAPAYDATVIQKVNVLDQYIDRLFDEPGDRRNGRERRRSSGENFDGQERRAGDDRRQQADDETDEMPGRNRDLTKA